MTISGLTVGLPDKDRKASCIRLRDGEVESVEDNADVGVENDDDNGDDHAATQLY